MTDTFPVTLRVKCKSSSGVHLTVIKPSAPPPPPSLQDRGSNARTLQKHSAQRGKAALCTEHPPVPNQLLPG